MSPWPDGCCEATLWGRAEHLARSIGCCDSDPSPQVVAATGVTSGSALESLDRPLRNWSAVRGGTGGEAPPVRGSPCGPSKTISFVRLLRRPRLWAPQPTASPCGNGGSRRCAMGVWPAAFSPGKGGEPVAEVRTAVDRLWESRPNAQLHFGRHDRFSAVAAHHLRFRVVAARFVIELHGSSPATVKPLVSPGEHR